MVAQAPKILFRVDASLHIGTGHVMRCLTLAHGLKLRGADCRFVCRAHEGNLIDYIKEQGFEVAALPFASTKGSSHADWLGTDWATDAAQTRAIIGPASFDWLIVDHYALDKAWERAMRPLCAQLMVIDDLADRPHDCDLLLDQNLGRESADYRDLVAPECTLLLGPEFALLRPEFAEWRAQSLRRRAVGEGLKNLLITMGGVDQHNITGQILAALKTAALPQDAEITVIMGPHAPWLDAVTSEAKAMPWPTRVLAGVSNMGELMAESDLAIGAAGSTSWERCCLGLPTLAIVLADNQAEIAVALDRAGAALELTSAELEIALPFALLDILNDDGFLTRASAASKSICDGTGIVRVANAMNEAKL